MNCTPAAIDEFPGDFFSLDQRNKGGILVHIFIAIYLIFGLAIICDDYFVPVLEIICDSLHLSNDVAGATFMAVGMNLNSSSFFDVAIKFNRYYCFKEPVHRNSLQTSWALLSPRATWALARF